MKGSCNVMNLQLKANCIVVKTNNLNTQIPQTL